MADRPSPAERRPPEISPYVVSVLLAGFGLWCFYDGWISSAPARGGPPVAGRARQGAGARGPRAADPRTADPRGGDGTLPGPTKGE